MAVQENEMNGREQSGGGGGKGREWRESKPGIKRLLKTP